MNREFEEMQGKYGPRLVCGGLALLLVLFLAAGCDDDGSPLLPRPGTEIWQVVNPIPPCNQLNDICDDGAGGLFVVGNAGTTLHLGATDRSFGILYDGITLWDAFANSPDDAYACSVWPFDLYHYDGESWSLHTEFTEIRGLWSPGPDVVFVASRYSVYEFDGTFWTEHVLPQSSNAKSETRFAPTVDDVWGTAADDVYALIGDSVAHFDGTNWALMADITASKDAIWGTAPDDIFTIGGGGRIAHFDGATWALQESGTTVTLNRIWGSGPADVYVLGDGNTILHFDGDTWSPMPIDVDYELHGIGGTGPGAVYVVGDMGTMFFHDGTSWQPYSEDTRQLFSAVFECPTGATWVAGSLGVSRFDGVNLYGTEPIPVMDLWGTDCDEIIGVGFGIFLFDGVSWEPESIPVVETFQAVWGRSGDEIYAVGNAGTILRYDGQAWQTEPSPIYTTLADVWGAPEAGGDVFIVGLAGTILHDSGSGWVVVDSGTAEHLTCVWGTSATNVYAAGLNVVLHYDGTSWAMVEGPDRLAQFGFNCIWGSDADNVYFGGQAVFSSDASHVRGVIMHYDGANWSLQRTGIQQGLTHIWGNETGPVYTVGSGGTILERVSVSE